MDNFFVFNGRGTLEFGMAVSKQPNRPTPTRRRSKVQIPGRNGDLHFDEGTFENITLTYDVWFRGGLPTPAQAHEVKAWLLAPKGYSRLEDKYDPEHFYLASFTGPMDIEDILGRYGRCKIKFDCDGRCFRKDGEFPIALENGSTLCSPTAFESTPVIYVYGNSAGWVQVGDVVVEILQMTTGMVLDCENLNAYALGNLGQSLNWDVSAPVYPVIAPGENLIAFGGGVDRIEIVPRWWDV